METPYIRFGKVVRELRVRNQETRRELSLNLEIAESLLAAIEKGELQPTEELVDQLVSHFELDEHSGDNLWRLAGYSDDIGDQAVTPIMVPLPDLKINYTDLVHVSVNNFGLVLNFMQHSGPSNNPMVVARLGMSKDHAKSVIAVMGDAIAKSEEQDKQRHTKKQPLSLPEQHPRKNS